MAYRYNPYRSNYRRHRRYRRKRFTRYPRYQFYRPTRYVRFRPQQPRIAKPWYSNFGRTVLNYTKPYNSFVSVVRNADWIARNTGGVPLRALSYAWSRKFPRSQAE